MEIEPTADNFETEVIEKSKEKPVLVDFWASWCGPCRMLTPVLEEVLENRDDFILAKISVEEYGDLASKYGVMSIPNVKLFKDGDIVAEFIGAKGESEVNSFLDQNLK